MENTIINGLSRLLDYGIAVFIMFCCGVACFYLVKYLLQRCDQRFTEALKMNSETSEKSLMLHKEISDKFSDVMQKNTELMNRVLEDIGFVKNTVSIAKPKSKRK